MKTEPINHRPDDDKQDIYAATTVMFVVFGGATAGLLLWLLSWFTVRRDTDLLLNCLMWGPVWGLPAAWLTARSVRKRGLRRDWRGCLKTAAFGAWWSLATVGSVLSLFVFMSFNAKGGVVLSELSELLLCLGLIAAIGAVTALLLSVFLPKPET